jgi:hypothetical protein
VDEVAFQRQVPAVEGRLTHVMEVKRYQRIGLTIQHDAAAGRIIHLDGMPVVNHVHSRRRVIELDDRQLAVFRMINVYRRLVPADTAFLIIRTELTPM